MKLWTTQRIAAALKVADVTVKRALRREGVEVHVINRSIKVRDSALIGWLGFDVYQDPLWTVQEAAREAGLSVASMERTIRSGRLGSIKVCGRLRRIRHSQLVRWLGFDPRKESAFPAPKARSSASAAIDQYRLF